MDEPRMKKKLSLDQLKAIKDEVPKELPKGVQKVEEQPKEAALESRGKKFVQMSADELRTKYFPNRKKDVNKTYLQEQFDDLDKAINRFKKEMVEFRTDIEEKEDEEKYNAEFGIDEEEPETSITVKDNKIVDDFLEDIDNEYEVPRQKLEDDTFDDLALEDDTEEDEEFYDNTEDIMTSNETYLEVDSVNELAEEALLEEEVKEEPVVEEVEETTTVKVKHSDIDESFVDTDDNIDIIDSDLTEVSKESESNTKERLAHIRSVVKKVYDSNLNKVDLSKFKVNKTPIAVGAVTRQDTTPIYAADWILHSSMNCISMTALNGPEISTLDVGNSNRGRYNAYKDMMNTLYNHVDNPQKGGFEQWLKTISMFDLEDLYFACYRACFGTNNYIFYNCPSCDHTYMIKKPISEMSVFKSEKSKAKYKAVMDKGPGKFTEYEAQLEQITDKYAVAIKSPSIYDTMFAPLLLPDEFREKHADLISTCAFIDGIYVINAAKQTITPISEKPVVGNENKTIRNKLSTYARVFKTFTPNEYARLKGLIANIGSDNDDDIEYVIPADICPKCGKEIPSVAMDPLQMLFTYHQLGQTAYISTK